MPPIKKMKSDSGWAGLNSYFTNKDEKLNKNMNLKKSKNLSNSENSIINYENYQLSSIADRKKLPSNNIATLLEACEPNKSSELAISKQKQNELNAWLTSDAIELGMARILVITGPSGCGKTVALKVLAKENKFDIIEWITPSDSNIARENFTLSRQADKFIEFVIRTTRYNSVLLSNNQTARRLLVVKDIPNVFFYEKESFHDLIKRYFEYGKEPLVFICPDTEASRVYQSLFPAEIINNYNIDTINVNATTLTAMKNMLKRVATILNDKGGHMLQVTQDHIDEVLSNSIGDVRSTILNIIFASLKIPDNKCRSGCEVREESLGLLHSVGRVINPKRVIEGESWKFVHKPDDIASSFQAQPTTFLRFIHENYLNTMALIEHVERATDILSLADTISTEWRDPNLNRLNLSLCTRGVMVCNETPITKWNPVRKPQSEEPKFQRDLGLAEERYYKTIIRPKLPTTVQILEDPIEPSDD